MLCKRCNVVMGMGTRYEQRKGRDRPPTHSRYYECKKCRDKVYTKSLNFQEILVKETGKRRKNNT